MPQEKIDTPLIFIVGPSRSGTSLLCNILGKHSRVVGLNELHMLGDLWSSEAFDQPLGEQRALDTLARLRARQLRGIWNDQVDAADMEFARELMADIRVPPTPIVVFRKFASSAASEGGKEMVAEQTPRNVLYAPQILAAFPEAKVVAMIRDPRAVLNSQRSRWQMKFLGAPNVPMAESIRVFVNYHAITMSKLWIKAVEMMDRLSSNPRVTVVKYEDLVSAPHETLSGLCDFLGIHFEDGMLAVGRIGSSTLRNDDQNAGISNKSRDAWQNSLPKGDREICEYLAGAIARRHGYECAERKLLSISSLLHLARLPLHIAGMLVSNPHRVWVMAWAFWRGGRV